MQDDKEQIDILTSILEGLELEYSLLKAEMQYEEKINRHLHDQGKNLRKDMFLNKNDQNVQNKTFLHDKILQNHKRICQLEDALQEKDSFLNKVGQVSRKVSKSIPSKLEKNIEVISELRGKTHTRQQQFEAQRNNSLQRVKKAITDHQALSVFNQSLSSFKSMSSLSLSNTSKASSSVSSSKKAMFKVVSKSKNLDSQIDKPPDDQFDFKKKAEPNYPRLKLFQYDPLPKNS